MGVLLALHLTFDGVQNTHIMELHFNCLKFPLGSDVIVGKLKHFSVRFQTVSMVVPFVDVWFGNQRPPLWSSVE